jgi:hypothetical protein
VETSRLRFGMRSDRAPPHVAALLATANERTDSKHHYRYGRCLGLLPAVGDSPAPHLAETSWRLDGSEIRE